MYIILYIYSRITNVDPKYPLLGENITMTCSIEVISSAFKRGIEIKWSGPNPELDQETINGRMDLDVNNSIKRIDDRHGKIKSYLISRYILKLTI